MFTKFDNVWHGGGEDDEIMQDPFTFHLTKFLSTHYRVKHKCSKLLHNAELFSK